MFTVSESESAKKLTEGKYSCRACTKPARNASDALQDYIDQFTNFIQTKTRTPKNGCYASSNVSHALPRQLQSASSNRKASKSPQKPGKMADDILQWVNDSYTKDLQRKIVPFGQKSNSSVEMSATDENDDNDEDDTSTISVSDIQISTLPSPGSSCVTDLDSDMGSVSTEVLVKSYYEHGIGSQLHEGSGNHPSWVEELTAAKHYPSWIDEIDESQISHQDSSHNRSNSQRNHLSRSFSPSIYHQHPLSFPRPPSILSTSLQELPPDEISVNLSHPSKQQMKTRAWDIESTDTEALIMESIYGRQPVNMGGKLHSSLYQDRRIEQLHDRSTRKFAKELEQSLVREMSFSPSRVEDEKIKENLSTNKQQSLAKPRRSRVPQTSVTKQINIMGSKNENNSEPRIQNQKTSSSSTEYHTNTKRPNSKIRKHSTDSSNTDHLMRQSPTGIQMRKQNPTARVGGNNYNKKGVRNSVQSSTPTVIRTSNIAHSSQDGLALNAELTPRQSASEELQRIIDLADLNPKEANSRRRQEHYLRGRVSKVDLTKKERYTRPETLNKNKRNVSKDDHSRLYDRHSKKEHFVYNNHLSRTDHMDLYPRRIGPQYPVRIPRWIVQHAANHRSNPDRSTPRAQTLWYSDPTKLKPGTKTDDYQSRLRLRTKSAPSITRESLPLRRKAFKVNVPSQNRVVRKGMRYANERTGENANYANTRTISGANYANERVMSERESYETESVDTEALVITPPMPLFDASPSLSTESEESGVKSEGSGDTLIENLALRTSFLAASDSELPSSSGTSYLELTTRRQQEERIPERSEEWEEEPRPNNSRLHFNTKPGIITSFLEDCMRSSQESRSGVSDNRQFAVSSAIEGEESVGSDRSAASERPVETLKKMLFTVQGLAHSNEGNSNNEPGVETESECLTEEILSDIISTASHNEGEDSLSRAYYHLARLKKLVSASKEVATCR